MHVGCWGNRVQQRRTELPEGRHNRFPSYDIPDIADNDRDDRGALGGSHQRGSCKRFIRAIAREIPVEAQHFPGLRHWVENHSRQHCIDGMNSILERRDDAKIAAAAPQAPEEVRVLIRTGRQKLPVGDNEIRRQQVVAAETVLPHQPAEAAAQGQSGNAGRRDDPAGAGQSKGLCLMVVFAPGEPCLRARRAPGRIDPHAFHA